MAKSKMLPPQATDKSLIEGLESLIQKLYSQFCLLLSGPQGKNQGIHPIYIYIVKYHICRVFSCTAMKKRLEMLNERVVFLQWEM